MTIDNPYMITIPPDISKRSINDERGVEAGHDGLVRHRQTKGSESDRLHLNRRATPRLHNSQCKTEE